MTLLEAKRTLELPDWGWGSWQWLGCVSLIQVSLSFKFGWILLSLSWVIMFQISWQRLMILLEAKRTLELPDWGWCSSWRFWWIWYCLIVIHAKTQLSTLSLMASRTPKRWMKLLEAKRTLELPDWGLGFWQRLWCVSLIQLSLSFKFGLILLSLSWDISFQIWSPGWVGLGWVWGWVADRNYGYA